MARPETAPDPFRWFDSPEIIRLVVMMYLRYPRRQGHIEGCG